MELLSVRLGIGFLLLPDGAAGISSGNMMLTLLDILIIYGREICGIFYDCEISVSIEILSV